MAKNLMLKYFEISFWLVAFIQETSTKDETVTVTTRYGKIRGKREYYGGRERTTFYGVPYGIPPVDRFRFVKPLRNTNIGIFDAFDEIKKCIKEPKLWNSFYYYNLDYRISNDTYSEYEDCLHLNIFIPTNSRDHNIRESSLPVAVILEQEDKETLGAVTTSLLESNAIIVVHLDYRSGVFGFFGTGDRGLGNYGLFDQQLGISWVRDNIRYFGGDPSDITLIGINESGIYAGLHALSEDSAKMLRRVIMHGMTPLHAMATDANPAGFTADLARHLMCPIRPHTDLLDCLRNISSYQLHRTSMSIYTQYGHGLQPVVDGEFLADFPETLAQQFRGKHIDYVIGTYSENPEVLAEDLFSSKLISEQVIYRIANEIAKKQYRSNAGKIASLAKVEYAYCVKNASLKLSKLAELIQDASLHSSTDLTARLYSGMRGRTFYYNIQATDQRMGKVQVASQLVDFWIKFIKKRDPATNGTTETVGDPWPAYSLRNKRYLQFHGDGDAPPRLGREFRAAKMAFWNEYVRSIHSGHEGPGDGVSSCHDEEVTTVEGRPGVVDTAFWIALGLLLASVLVNLCLAIKLGWKDIRHCLRLCWRRGYSDYRHERLEYRYTAQDKLPYFEEMS